MTTGLLFDTMNPEPAHHRWVPDTSKAAHTAGINAGRIGKRSQDVLAWLLEWTRMHNDAPTSAELARWVSKCPQPPLEWTLNIRRGLSDLLKAGYVYKGVDRECVVTTTKANTWKAEKR